VAVLASALLLGVPAGLAAPARAQAQSRAQDGAGDAYLVGYDQRPEVLAFIGEMVQKHGFVATELQSVFAHARYNDTVAGLMGPGLASRPVPWSEYRARFVEPTRIEAALRFWQAHADDLERAERLYGVPAQIIVAILDIETLFGRNTGNFRVLDALTTLAFDYPNKDHDRSAFFREELEDFLVLARDQSMDVLGVRGSYAGAIGIPQFMPSSIMHYAVDFDGDGTIDLKNSPSDAIGSVANFLSAQGWQRGARILYRLSIDEASRDGVRLDALVAAGSEPRLSWSDLRGAGLVLTEDSVTEEPLVLIDLPDGDNPPVYLAGTRNFFVLTRYNRSYAYASAVVELAQAVRQRRATPLSRPAGPARPSSAAPGQANSGTQAPDAPAPLAAPPAPRTEEPAPPEPAPAQDAAAAPHTP
jgi:membrane-bound lytic murein transglycosylase B